MARLANQMKQLYAMCATALVMGRADLDGADDVGFDIELPSFLTDTNWVMGAISLPLRTLMLESDSRFLVAFGSA